MSSILKPCWYVRYIIGHEMLTDQTSSRSISWNIYHFSPYLVEPSLLSTDARVVADENACAMKMTASGLVSISFLFLFKVRDKTIDKGYCPW